MNPVVLLSSACPGIPLDTEKLSGQLIDFVILPAGVTLSDRVLQLSSEQRAAAVAVVSVLTDSLHRAELSKIKQLLPELKLISNYAVGYNNIDVDAASQLSIAVTNTPGVLGDATADLTIALLLMVTRKLWTGAFEIHSHGRFAGWSPEYGLGIGLAGKTLGIVGLGDIGRRVASRAAAFGMRVVALQSPRPATHPQDDTARLGEDEFLAQIDVLSFHCPLTPESRGWLNRARLARLKRGVVIINTARGEVIDEGALADALRRGHVFGAGLDVFCGEPVVSDALHGAPNLLILPHLGSATVETRSAMGACVMENVRACLAGHVTLPTQVNR